jgi:hypothetical protein
MSSEETICLAVWWFSASLPRFASRFARQWLQVISMLSHHGFFSMEGYCLFIGKRERCLS